MDNNNNSTLKVQRMKQGLSIIVCKEHFFTKVNDLYKIFEMLLIIWYSIQMQNKIFHSYRF